MKILIADDSSFYRELLEKALSSWGYEVLSVADGSAAWEVLRGPQAPRIAILDWLMPGMNGLEICEAVRKSQMQNPPYLLILTVKFAREDLLAALRAGCDDFLTKPFDNEELKARLEVACRITSLLEKLTHRVETLENALRALQSANPAKEIPGPAAGILETVC